MVSNTWISGISYRHIMRGTKCDNCGTVLPTPLARSQRRQPCVLFLRGPNRAPPGDETVAQDQDQPSDGELSFKVSSGDCGGKEGGGGGGGGREEKMFRKVLRASGFWLRKVCEDKGGGTGRGGRGGSTEGDDNRQDVKDLRLLI